MNEEIKKYLQDILDALTSVEQFTTGVTSFYQYRDNLMMKAAVERKLEIVGEAMNKASRLAPDLEISSKQKIISLRNRIIHAYDAVDDILIWEVVQKHLPVLKQDVSNLLN